MHRLQRELLGLAESGSLDDRSLREMGELIGEEHPQKVKYHLDQLVKRHLVSVDVDARKVRALGKDKGDILFSIPILGAANAGQPSLIAEDNIQGYLKVSRKAMRPKKGLFALRVVGDSMDRAKKFGGIEPGSYVVVDSTERKPENNAYVVAVIDDLATIKKFRRTDGQVLLVSESSNERPPIVLHESDQFDSLIAGTVVSAIPSQSS